MQGRPAYLLTAEMSAVHGPHQYRRGLCRGAVGGCLRAGAPVGQQVQEVGDADGTVAVEVGRAAGIRSPSGEQIQEVVDAYAAAPVEVPRAGRDRRGAVVWHIDGAQGAKTREEDPSSREWKWRSSPNVWIAPILPRVLLMAQWDTRGGIHVRMS